MNILIENGIILPMNATNAEKPYFRGIVGIEHDHIAFIDTDDSKVNGFLASHADVRRIDATGKIVMPGLINTHTHVAMALLRGISDDMPLME